MVSITFSATAIVAFFASIVISHALPMPEVLATAMAYSRETSYKCHSNCDNAIIQARNCKDDTSC